MPSTAFHATNSSSSSSSKLILSYQPPTEGSLLLRAFCQFAGIKSFGNLPKEDRIVLSAQKCAACRALDYESESPLAPDPFARLLSGSQYAITKKKQAAVSLRPRIAIRTKYFDNFIESKLNQLPNAQLVLLGAGMDARIYRFSSALKTSHTVFELDAKSVFDVKEYLLNCIHPAPTPITTLKRIAANLRHDKWVEKILASGFDPKIPSIWVLEGVLYYLEQRRVDELLNEIRAISADSSCLIFSAVTKISEKREGIFISSMKDPVGTLACAGFSGITVDVLGGANANFNRYPVPQPQVKSSGRKNGLPILGKATIYVKASVVDKN